MNPLVNKISVQMVKDKPLRLQKFINDKHVDLTENEMNSKVYTESDWSVEVMFDWRALPDGFPELDYVHDDENFNSISTQFLMIERREFFKPMATVKEMFERIHNGLCYGFFEGLELKYLTQAGPVFKMKWGT